MDSSAVRNCLSHYRVTSTPGRERVISSFESHLAVLQQRAAEHKDAGNPELEDKCLRLVQRGMIDFEQFCRKWEECDERGVIY